MKKQTVQLFKVRTALQAGTSCGMLDTNCKGKDKHGKVVWDNCDHWKPFAGSNCWDAVNEAGGGTCYKC